MVSWWVVDACHNLWGCLLIVTGMAREEIMQIILHSGISLRKRKKIRKRRGYRNNRMKGQIVESILNNRVDY